MDGVFFCLLTCEDFVNAIDTQGGFVLQWKWRTFFYGDFVEISKILLTKFLPYPIIIIKMEKVDFSMEIFWISKISIASQECAWYNGSAVYFAAIPIELVFWYAAKACFSRPP